MLCEDEDNQGKTNCFKNKTENLRILLRKLMITLHLYDEKVNFNEFHDKPVSGKLMIYDQFELFVDKYRDENNFVTMNKISTIGQGLLGGI